MQKPTFIESLRGSVAVGGPAVRLATGNVCILDPQLARQIETLNFRDAPMPERLFEPKGKRALWRDVRRAVQAGLRRSIRPEVVAAYHRDLFGLLTSHAQSETDLTTVIAEAVCESAISFVFADYDPVRDRAIVADQRYKLEGFLVNDAADRAGWTRRIWQELLTGIHIRRRIGARRNGHSPPQDDIVQSIMALDAELSRAEIAYAVMTVLTALAGAPGATGACLAFELHRRPEMRDKIAAEIGAVDEDEFYADPAGHAPFTLAFVRESMRLWPFPVLVSRRSKNDFSAGGLEVEAGEFYHLSAFFTHRAEEAWQAAESFDPDRWDQAAARCPHYVPFGWSARSCPGASVGMMQMMVLAKILTCDATMQVSGDPHMEVFGTPLPRQFTGRIEAVGV